MLTPIDDAPPVVTASGTSGVDKQIVAVGSGANTVVYTVPDGRKFVGYASNTSWVNGSYWTQLEKDGVAVYHYNGFSSQLSSGYTGPPTPILTILAGTVVKVGNGGNVHVFGVESDA